MNHDTPRTNKKVRSILADFGPNNGQRFASMADYARDQERQLLAIARLVASLRDSPKSLQQHLEEWAVSFQDNP
jgi:hypothetical protein